MSLPKGLGRVVFARVGLMRFYAGPVPGDDRPVGGGKYNRTEIGSEVLNFKRRGQHLYGYFETTSQNAETNLERIDTGAAGLNALDDVLVILVAQYPARGQVIVGWYGSAKVLRQPKWRPAPDNDYGYRCVAKVKGSVLLPDSKRLHVIPTGAGAMGQSNVCYSLEADGSSKGASWMQNAVDYVGSYDGENLLVDTLSDAENDIAAEAERALSRAQGRWIANANQRKALEDYGVSKAMAYFVKAGFSVEDVGAKASYDVHCTKNGKTLRVEVKATTTSGEQVILTPREVGMTGERALFVMHSVSFVRGKPTGGASKVIWPWRVDARRLKALGYTYKVPDR